MEPPHSDIDDFVYWKFTEDGSYSVQSGYLFLGFNTFGSTVLASNSSFQWTRIWKLCGSTKFALLLWRLGHNIMPTAENLTSRGIGISSTCNLCHNAPESADNLFRSCSIAHHVWKTSSLGLDTQVNASILFPTWLANMISYFSRHSSISHNCLLYFCSVLHAIWSIRNAAVFRGEPVQTMRICQLADFLALSHQQLPDIWSSLASSHSLPCAPPEILIYCHKKECQQLIFTSTSSDFLSNKVIVVSSLSPHLVALI
ncbi:uncharacterized protein LOC141627724 [Silene latifolia]|uniref:uncharacterized protein LOC141627724 n=1 Tax=Silene latifolia TaxID=37657 RepID=UPI003D78B12A